LAAGALDRVTSEDVSALSEQEFIDRFEYLDLAALMKAANVSSYRELQADFPRLYRLHYTDPPPFNPTAPARKVPLRVSVLFFPTLDLEGALRRLIQGKRVLDALRPRAGEYEGGPSLATSAWVGVFPAGGPTPPTPPLSQDQVFNLFAAEGFLAAFEAVP
jgi:hypothetical protein